MAEGLGETYAQFPHWLMFLDGPSLAARGLWCYLTDRQGRNASAWPSVTRMAADLKIHRESVIHLVHELEHAEPPLLVVIRSQGRVNRYQSVKPTSRTSRLVEHPDYPSRTSRLVPVGKPDYHQSVNPTVTNPLNQPIEPTQEPTQLAALPKKFKLKRERTEKQQVRDALWDAVVAEWSLPTGTKTQLGRIGRLVTELRGAGAKPDDIPIRRNRILDTWGTGTDTPESVVKHWGELGGTGLFKTEPGQPTPEEQRRFKAEVKRWQQEKRKEPT